MYLFFDTETTGLPRSWKAPVSDTDNWPRMVQLAWVVCDVNGKMLEERNCIIKPEGFTIPPEASSVHRITTERALADGQDLKSVLKIFAKRIEGAQSLVAHNISFDEKIVGAEFLRKDIQHGSDKKQSLCTMQASTEYCKIPGSYGYKWPRLSELHKVLFGEDFEEAHDASADIQATVRCFWKLKELGIIDE